MEVLMLLDNPLKSDSRVEKEALSLTLAGHTVSIYAMAKNGLPEKEVKRYGTIYRVIPEVIHRPFSEQYKTFLKEFPIQIASIKFDVLHCHDYKMLLLGSAVKKQKPDIKLVYDAHEFLSGWPYYKEIKGLVNRIKGRIVWGWFAKAEAKNINNADAIITVSHSIAEAMEKRFRLKNKIEVIRNIPLKTDIKNDGYLHRHFNLTCEAKIVVHTGNLYHSEKRINMLMKAARHFKHVHFVFIGDSDKIKSLAEKNKDSKVHFHNYAGWKTLSNMISSAHFGIVHTWQPGWLSHWLSLPNRIMEYTAAGIPVICTTQPEFIKFGNRYKHAVYYKGNSLKELVNAISDGLNRYEKLKENAILASTKISWEQEAKKLLTLYSHL